MNKNLKGFKKLIGILLLLTMIASNIPAFAISEVSVEIPTLTDRVLGTDVDVPVTFKGLPTGTKGFEFSLDYDKDKLTYKSATKGTGYTTPEPAVDAETYKGRLGVAGLTTNEGVSGDQVVITLTFTINPSAPVGTTDLTVLNAVYSNGNSNNYISSDKIVNGSITTRASSGRGSSTPPPPPPNPNAPPTVVAVETKPVVTNDKATTQLSETDAKIAIDEAIKKARASGSTSEIIINAETKEPVVAVETVVKENTVSQLKNNNIDKLTVNTNLVDVTFDKKAIEVINQNTENSVSLSVQSVKKSELSEEAQKEVGDRPVFDIKLISNGKRITDFKDGSVKVTIPYELKEGEKAGNIIVYYIGDDGKTLKKMENVRYDETLKAAVFYTNHFSKYAISFDKTKVVFTDVYGWAEEFVYYLAEKNIIKGKAEGIFAPNDNVTRAEFVAIIARALGVDTSNTAYKNNFSDVKQSDWFSLYVSWAKERKIINGYEDGSFAPNKQITREELCTMIVRAITSSNIDMGNSYSSFADSNTVSDWAKNSVELLAKFRIVTGRENNIFAPKDFATRAETAKIIYGILLILN